MNDTDYIAPETAKTLPGLFYERVMRSPHSQAYGFYDDEKNAWESLTWEQVAQFAARIQEGLRSKAIVKGDRVAIMLRNCPEWVIFDVAALGLGLVTVPLYTNDRAENVAYIVQNAGIKAMLVQNSRQWRQLSQIESIRRALQCVISVAPISKVPDHDSCLVHMQDWIDHDIDVEYQPEDLDGGKLATIIYTSGTTGRPKGVMLSHRNILSNASAALQCADIFEKDVFLSFLPLSHSMERTAGCFMPMMASSKVCFARSIQQLGEDIQEVRPTVFVSVPRIYEIIFTRILSQAAQLPYPRKKMFAWAQRIGWRYLQFKLGRAGWHWSLLLWPMMDRLVAAKIKQRLGGRLRYAIVGGAALDKTITKFFVSLGIPVYQGYGMTESSPVISVGRPDANDPFSVGKALPGVEVKLTKEGELCTRSDCVMLGYYGNKQATEQMIDTEGWLHTGDIAHITDEGYLYITGRIKDIIVLANAEKVSPQDMETAICADPLFDQAMILGEGRPFLSALLVLNETEWNSLAESMGLGSGIQENLQDASVHKYVMQRLAGCLKEFPGYAQVRRAGIYLEPWTTENNLLTPTLKTRRNQLIKLFADDIEAMYDSMEK
ncbi:MAG: long-chain fatty acid--CoA ligase [Proteobacteria bacterium]|nr:long-chain fatty acid--CoA ligase [Pseudomonadota bacterium]